MKRLFLAISVLALALTSCQKNQGDQNDSDVINLADYEKITADFPEEMFGGTVSDTKSGFINTHRWNVGDSVTVFMQMLSTDLNVESYGSAFTFKYNGHDWEFFLDPRIAAMSGKTDVAKFIFNMYTSGKAFGLYMAQVNGKHQAPSFTASAVGNVSPETYVSTAQLSYLCTGSGLNNTIHFEFCMIDKNVFEILTPQEVVVPVEYFKKNFSCPAYSLGNFQKIEQLIFCTGNRLDDPNVPKYTFYYKLADFDIEKTYTAVNGNYYFFFPKEADLSTLKVNPDGGYKLVKDTVHIDRYDLPQFVTRYTITK